MADQKCVIKRTPDLTKITGVNNLSCASHQCTHRQSNTYQAPLLHLIAARAAVTIQSVMGQPY